MGLAEAVSLGVAEAEALGVAVAEGEAPEGTSLVLCEPSSSKIAHDNSGAAIKAITKGRNPCHQG